jgi:hypothetical protein
VEDTRPHAKAIAGIGLDVPHDGEHFDTRPEDLRDYVLAAMRAGAHGVILSREYDEMRVANLRAAGEAFRLFDQE